MIDKFMRYAATMGSIMASDSKVTSLWGQDAEESAAEDLLEEYESDQEEDFDDDDSDELEEERRELEAERMAIMRERRRIAAERRALELAQEGVEEIEQEEDDAPPVASKPKAEQKGWSKAKMIGISVAVGTAVGAALAAGTVFWWTRRSKKK